MIRPGRREADLRVPADLASACQGLGCRYRGRLLAVPALFWRRTIRLVPGIRVRRPSSPADPGSVDRMIARHDRCRCWSVRSTLWHPFCSSVQCGDGAARGNDGWMSVQAGDAGLVITVVQTAIDLFWRHWDGSERRVQPACEASVFWTMQAFGAQGDWVR